MRFWTCFVAMGLLWTAGCAADEGPSGPTDQGASDTSFSDPGSDDAESTQDTEPLPDTPGDALPPGDAGVEVAQDSGSDASQMPDAEPDLVADAGHDGGAADGDAATEGPIQIGGGVFLLDIDSDALDRAGASARFTDYEPLPEIPEAFFPCTVGLIDPDDESPPDFGFDSGMVTVSGTLEPVVLAAILEDGTGTGYSSNLDPELADLLPAGGALITIQAAGGNDIASWSGVVQTPEPVTIGSPVMGLGKSHGVGSDLDVTWNAGTGDVVVVSLSPLSGLFQPEKGQVATCWFTEDDGSGAVPAGILSQVLDGQGSQNVAVGVTRVRTGTATNEEHIIPLTAARASGGLLSLKP